MAQMAPGPTSLSRSLVQAGLDFKRYKSIYIAPVHTGFLLQSNWWQQNFRQGQMQEDLATMAQYMRTNSKPPSPTILFTIFRWWKPRSQIP